MRLFRSRERKSSEREVPAPAAEYYSSDTDLYHVEQVRAGRVLVEDCRTGALVDVPVAQLERLRPVRRRHRHGERARRPSP